MKGEITLGDMVVDTITGFKGIAVAKHLYLNGCARISVSPKVGEDGKLAENQAFDEPQLKIVKKSVVCGSTDANGKTGGPAHIGDRGRSIPKQKAV